MESFQNIIRIQWSRIFEEAGLIHSFKPFDRTEKLFKKLHMEIFLKICPEDWQDSMKKMNSDTNPQKQNIKQRNIKRSYYFQIMSLLHVLKLLFGKVSIKLKEKNV